jgi:predicted nucleic acid-binding protein
MEFFDTNILVYAVDHADPIRQRIAAGLLREALEKGGPVISTQVMLEFRAVATRRKLLTGEGITRFLRGLTGANVVAADLEFIWKTFETQERFGFSVWDAAIVHAALEARCDVIYTEDLQHGQRIDSLEIVNPFRGHVVHEPRPAYAAKRPAARRSRTLRK